MVDKILTHEPAGNFVAQKAMHELAEILNAQAFKENLMHASKLKFWMHELKLKKLYARSEMFLSVDERPNEKPRLAG